MVKEQKERQEIFNLTKREMEVLQWLKHGKTSSDIVQILDIKERTVNFHVNNVIKKLKASNRTNAVVIACSKGIIKID